MRDTFVETLCRLADEDPRVTLVTGDLGFGVLDPFRSKFGQRYINAGVAEQNMTMVATGLALEGRIVFTYSIANFPTLRCLEMIRNDAAYHEATVKVVAIGGGFSYGSLGISHHATEDLAIMRALPGVDVFSPGGQFETEQVTRALAARPGTGYLRLDKDPGVESDAPFHVGVPRLVCQGRDIVLFATGGIVSEARAAVESLRERGIHVSLFSVHSLSPLDGGAVCSIVRRHRQVVSIEEHTINGGLGAALLEVLADAGVWPSQFVRVGLDRCFSSVVGSQSYLRSTYGLDARRIAERVAALALMTKL